ncbi:family 1 glycosylhydrolase [Spiroplasma kunkelii]
MNDFYHRYQEDIKIVRELNFNSLRTLIQWTRLIHDGKTVNPKGIEFYNNVINEMLKNNIKPIINLFDFDMLILSTTKRWLAFTRSRWCFCFLCKNLFWIIWWSSLNIYHF